MRSTVHSSLRHRRRVVVLLCAVLMFAAAAVPASSVGSQQGAPAYLDARLPVERRVADLVSRMTPEEKVAQLVCLWAERPQAGPQTDFSVDRGDLSPERARVVMKHGIGQIARQRERKDPREAARFANAVQKWLKENTRLGIPAVFHDEALHGLMAPKGTHFPQPLALASSWDTEFVTRVFTAAALGPHRRDLRRRPLSRLAHGRRGHPRLAGSGADR